MVADRIVQLKPRGHVRPSVRCSCRNRSTTQQSRIKRQRVISKTFATPVTNYLSRRTQKARKQEQGPRVDTLKFRLTDIHQPTDTQRTRKPSPDSSDRPERTTISTQRVPSLTLRTQADDTVFASLVVGLVNQTTRYHENCSFKTKI